MPAQWPTFIKNLSDKLNSMSINSRDEFAKFVAKEYFDSVKTAQSPFGQTHISGQYSILEQGFVKAFKKIYEEETKMFDDKFLDDMFKDFDEPLSTSDYSFDSVCEIEKCIEKHKDKTISYIDYRKDSKPRSTHDVNPLIFYSLFEFTCPEETPQQNATVDIEEFEIEDENGLYAKLNIFGFTENIQYKFQYSINGVSQPLESPDINGLLLVRVTPEPGEFIYTFNAVYDSENNLIKEINKSVIVTNTELGEQIVANILADESNKVSKKVRIAEKFNNSLDDKPTFDAVTEALALRILQQNDGTQNFLKWVNRLDDTNRNKSLARAVKNRVKSLAPPTGGLNNRYLPKIEVNLSLNKYILQEDYQIVPKVKESDTGNNGFPSWLKSTLIVQFTYVESIDKPNLETESRRLNKKEKLYKEEVEVWRDRIVACISSSVDEFTEEQGDEGDGYDVMSNAIIDYWKSTAIQPLKASPPAPPCNTSIPLGGKYVPVFYGNKKSLANNLRRAWNTGKRFKLVPVRRPAAQTTATAVASAYGIHLAELKFIYMGGITTPASPVPMIGFIPTVF